MLRTRSLATETLAKLRQTVESVSCEQTAVKKLGSFLPKNGGDLET